MNNKKIIRQTPSLKSHADCHGFHKVVGTLFDKL